MYEIRFAKPAYKQLAKFPPRVQKQLVAEISLLAVSPRKLGTEKMSDGSYRTRVGSYRIVFDISDKAKTVLILKLGHRKEIYR